MPPHGLAAVLADAAEVLGGSRKCVIARELTKMNEEFHRSMLQTAAAHYQSHAVKVGEKHFAQAFRISSRTSSDNFALSRPCWADGLCNQLSTVTLAGRDHAADLRGRPRQPNVYRRG